MPPVLRLFSNPSAGPDPEQNEGLFCPLPAPKTSKGPGPNNGPIDLNNFYGSTSNAGPSAPPISNSGPDLTSSSSLFYPIPIPNVSKSPVSNAEPVDPEDFYRSSPVYRASPPPIDVINSGLFRPVPTPKEFGAPNPPLFAHTNLPNPSNISDLQSAKTETIHVFRHAEGLHNVVANGGNIPDPYLTTLGLTQCAHIQRIFPQDIDIFIASPLKRTIQTAIFCFAKALEGGTKKIHLVPELQEVGGYPCNTISPSRDLIREFGDIIDVSRLGVWPTRDASESAQAVQWRASLARGIIQQIIDGYRIARPDAGNINVVVVSHGQFIPYLTQDFTARMWNNTGNRSYQYAKPTMDLVETDASKSARSRGELTLGISEEDNRRGRELQSDFVARRMLAKESNSTIFDFSNPLNQQFYQ
ncbi:histidine phosphatase superfamily [Annulohypoxylon truncatum]|uniref:histidine phosphatase superfamily n=1 Tax=Annulohypoxylon truncatum TaxID=327061 RepID=UPI0020080E02|nr:histidine phosphatase superfamily [Annulohypoxylon truncatum]KAI1214486.1 histidine phosphatase superfamily [Annulohypoxylon truncatum]